MCSIKKTIGKIAALLAFQCAVALIGNSAVFAAEAVIKLPPPDKSGGIMLMDAMNKRRSDRSFGTGELSPQQLSNLLWAAGGINRPEDGKRTVPLTSMKKEGEGPELDIFLISPAAVHHYDPAKNELRLVAEGDHRAAAAGPQKFVNDSPLNIVLVSGQKNDLAAGVTLGHSSQNIYLYCASAGLNAVTRMTMDRKAMAELLKLPEGQRALLILTVGPRP